MSALGDDIFSCFIDVARPNNDASRVYGVGVNCFLMLYYFAPPLRWPPLCVPEFSANIPAIADDTKMATPVQFFRTFRKRFFRTKNQSRSLRLQTVLLRLQIQTLSLAQRLTRTYIICRLCIDIDCRYTGTAGWLMHLGELIKLLSAVGSKKVFCYFQVENGE